VALAAGFFGNHVMHEAALDFERATGNINNIVTRAQEMAQKYNDVFLNGIQKNLVSQEKSYKCVDS
jgi:hypothetical protein